ncbi:anhydro-N-acetylmuramic acid kinase [Listeria weihenstephanensis FSL R9-0317]|uniref:Anhydro-N-acetylmuramic acid kinase n=1 Tax=Listeria weihenstephanensis TaxID=1006155 RepID=A0A1S7FSS4_9LIST|nr:anhydro-N-acetylmuramic acid kinase AnmK [Listeria weihenstephanensis]AQY50450.1 anhydro-N-acetylmuramic acid kinase [Listeria weihenstephanensis]EUJ41463.1 anhydro-N-acetylmuramic acid kinase [Listeria weihenstephanensis FSL R9-0317]
MTYVVGLMSGTSLDGVDIALLDITEPDGHVSTKLIDFETVSFQASIVDEIRQSLSMERSDSRLICSLNFKLGVLFAECVKMICSKNGISASELGVIGSHGQTIFHQPEQVGDFAASTLQIGEPAVIAYETGATVVSNFRTMDMAAGGQGAPLVPFTELLLYRDPKKNRLLQNIGGIGNVTVLPHAATLDQVFAFDTGPGNMIIDDLMQRLFNRGYDESGEIAESGTVNQALLAECMKNPFIKAPIPKSTGRELFGKEYTDHIFTTYSHLPAEDLIATMTMFTARTIVSNYEQFVFPKMTIDEVIVSGGGSYNKTLLRYLAELLDGKCAVLTQEDIGYSSDAKEAVAFGLLGYETLHRRPSNVPNATGAREHVILGNVTYPPLKY